MLQNLLGLYSAASSRLFKNSNANGDVINVIYGPTPERSSAKVMFPNVPLGGFSLRYFNKVL